MKHKGLLIASIVLLSLVVLLLGGLMVWLLTGHSFSVGRSVSVSGVATEVVYDDDFEKLTEIAVDVDCGDISFEENKSGKFHLTAYGENKNLLTVTEKDGVLNVNYPAEKRLFNTQITKNQIVLSLPADYEGKIKLSSDYGDITLCSLEKADVQIDSDYGNIEIEAVYRADVSSDCGNVEIGTAAEAKVEENYGNITVGEVTGSCQLENDCGDITVGKASLTADSTINNDLGTITVGSVSGVRVKAKTDLGNLNVRQGDDKSDITMTITNSCGDINVG